MTDNAQNLTLLREAQSGNEGALEEFASENMGLVRSIAARFAGRGIEYEDLVQIGCIGMIKAVKSFDFSYRTAFSTYAVPLIAGEIKRFLRDEGPLKVPRSLRRLGAEAMRKREEFLRVMGREPRMSELSKITGTSEEELVRAYEAVCPVRSIYDAGKREDEGALIDVLPDEDGELEKLTDRLALRQAIGNLPELQRKIVVLRYYKELSQEMTGRALGISQVKVSREEKKILTELRKAL